MTIHAVYENGVFRPTDKVAFPEQCEVEIEVHQVKEPPTIPILDDVYAILGRSHSSGEHDLAERRNGDQSLSRRVRIVGILDVIRASNQTFVLLMPDESEVPCTLLDGNVESLATLLRSRVLIFGNACFDPAGRLLHVEVDEYRLATDADRFFSKVPKPFGLPRGKYSRPDADKMAQGLKSIIGKWTGDETDEQIEAAAERMTQPEGTPC